MRKFLRIDKEILRFNISVDYIGAMTEGDTFNHLINVES